ncbi:SusC/RagA family TonB-linked outer membrane protein [Pontibacter silvestris]|uniref:SusC/RagA family TonB-linked outer membrane protein n=1 Tax=Pontibacter silvestris TaxID=2305183 RepID=A0ABW4WZ26_9BACT|nr:TonB-dependent receptor [Pontibacter silvestris]MCC9135603.1 TonB-dependent receptor [Pontibacter silvestris]
MQQILLKELRYLLVIPLFLLSIAGAWAQGITVQGKVTDENGTALPGVTVLLKGGSTAAPTDANGAYSITVPNGNGTLVFSYIGFQSQEVPINNLSTIDVQMGADAEALEEVVVVGYGTQRRQDVTGAISSIKADDIVTQGANTVEKSLQGRVAGVQVESAGGNPGSGVRILVRGTGSLNNNNPLYIVDGVQVDNINNLAPTDIASMDILKDASAAAIYGSRAANGVVLITTKSGRKGENVIDFNAYYGIQNITKKLDLLNASEWAQVSNAAYNAAGLEPLDIAQNPQSLGKGTDWQDEIYRTAPMQNYNLAASGGGDAYTYSLSGGYLSQDGIVKNTGYDRWNLRLKSDFTKGRVRIGESVILSKETFDPLTGGLGGQGGNPVGSAIKMIPVFDVYNPDAIGGYGGAYGPVVDIANPVAQLNLRDVENNVNKAIINAFAEVSILDGLKYKFNVGYTNTSEYYYEYTRPYQIGALFTNLDADLYESRNQTNYFLQEHTLSYDKMFGKHNIQALVGYTYQNTQYRILEGRKSGMPDGISVIDAGTSNTASGSRAWENALISYLGRLIYSYDDRYVLTAIVRRDGSSRFGNNYQYGNFPSLAFAWNASSEEFFEPLESVFSMLKIRASYGELGNQEIEDYGFVPSISPNLNYVIGTEQTLWPGAIQTAFATPNIKWESSKTLDFGADLGFFNNKLFLTADYFIRRNTDILLQVPIPLSTGASSNNPYINAGQITNRGFEAALSYNNTVNDFTYGITGTFSSVNNEVDNLGTGSQQMFGGQPTHHGASATVTQAGYPVGAFYLIKTNGIFNSQEEINAHSYEGQLIQPNAKPGDIRFVDYNNDGQIDQNDRQFLGSPTPKFTYGFGGSLEWKGFDMNLFFQGTYGNKIYNGLRQDMESMNLNTNYSTATLNAWTPENHTDFPRAVINDPNLNSQTSDRFLENGSYLRFKTLQFGYTLPKSLLDAAKINSCRVYLSFDNLFTITNYKGYNPDLGRTGSVLDRGVDFGHAAYPLARTSMVGVQLSF